MRSAASAQIAAAHTSRSARPALLAGAAALALTVLVEQLTTVSSFSTVAPVGALLAAIIAMPGRYRFGVLIALAALAGLDALPGRDLETWILAGGLHAQDVVVIVLCLVLAVDNLRTSFGGLLRDRIGFLVVLACLAFVLWWLVVLYRSSHEQGLSFNHSANFGRDLLLFVVMIPLLAGSLQRRDVRNAMLVTLAVGTALVAALYCAEAITHRALPTLLHVQQVRQVGGITRVFSPVIDLFSAAFPLALGMFLMGRTLRVRVLAGMVTALTLLALVLSLTRAIYLGSIAGVIIAAVVWLPWRVGPDRHAFRRLAYAAASVVVLVIALVVIAPQSKVAHSVNSVTSRLASVTSTAASSNPNTSTVAVRFNEASLLEDRLGGQWLAGLGFIDPRDRYDPSLPGGSIRNSDVGLLNVTMTMGVVGTILYYLPLLLITGGLLVRARSRRTSTVVWLGFGVLAWCIGTLMSSVTLVTLFSPTGVVSAAVMVGLGAAVLLHGGPTATEPLRTRR